MAEIQLDLFGLTWIDAKHAMPNPGERVVLYYRHDDGRLGGPVIGTPIHANGSHILDGKNIYKPTVYWLRLPTLTLGENE